MPPQESIPKAATVLGTLGTICWCVQIIPQIWKNHRRRSTDGVPGLMLFIWAICIVPLGAYAIIQNFTLAIQVQPQLFCFLCLICWGQTLFYHSKYKAWQAALVAIATGASFGGLELILILTLRGPYGRGITWPITLLGVLAAVLLPLGLIFPFLDLWKHGGRVVGISFGFLAIDFAGAFFSLLALVAQKTFDTLGGISYISVMVMEIGIVVCHLIWLWRTREIHKAARRVGMGYDKFVSTSDAGSHDPQSSFVRLDDVPDWPRSARVSAILFALRKAAGDEEKQTVGTAEVGRARQGTVRDPKVLAAVNSMIPELQEPSEIPHPWNINAISRTTSTGSTLPAPRTREDTSWLQTDNTIKWPEAAHVSPFLSPLKGIDGETNSFKNGLDE